MSTLELFKWRYSNNAESGYTVVPLTTNSDIQEYFLQLATKLKNVDVTINDNLANRLHGCLKERLHKVQKLQLRLIYRYLNDIERLVQFLAAVPHGSLNQTRRDEVQLVLNEIMNELTDNLEDLKEKAGLINDLNKQKFQYNNVAEYNLDNTDDEQGWQHVLLKNNRRSHILCSNDTFNSKNPSKLNALLRQLAEDRKSNQNLRLIYADFSYCSFNLFDMMILPTSSSSSLPKNDVINILLLGETGVGKSTFINAFVNYLTFDTLKQAERNRPVALIPVSFLMTTGHDFHEHLVTYGGFDSSNNEDFDHPGQSVTQHCKSHLFDLSNGKKLCIIDTPGFGDTRGLDQDDINMQHILKYINNLTHVNAICFLLKPNASRLNIFFRSCLTQLFDLLGSNAHQNIIFCFTNARSTFYTPGNTAPLLRAMLDSLSINDIPFKKENTFCFDNESFRYLVALQNGIQFDEEEKHEYEMSWSTSVSESNRLLNYIDTQLNVYPLHHNWQSNKYVQIEIIQMIRPILEGMKNILRNMILRKVGCSDKSIVLCPKAICRPTVFCISCKRDPFLLINFWILPDHPHELQNRCLSCKCEANQHILVDYILGYDISNDSTSDQPNEKNDMLDQLCLASVEFAYFLINVTRSTEEDVFLIGLIRMIEEETQICATVHEPNHLNSQLVEELEKLKQKYEVQMEKFKSSQKKPRDSQAISKRIKAIYQFPIIRQQMAVIKEKKGIRMQ